MRTLALAAMSLLAAATILAAAPPAPITVPPPPPTRVEPVKLIRATAGWAIRASTTSAASSGRLVMRLITPAGTPASVAGILIITLGRSTRPQYWRACSSVPAVSWASRGATSSETSSNAGAAARG